LALARTLGDDAGGEIARHRPGTRGAQTAHQNGAGLSLVPRRSAGQADIAYGGRKLAIFVHGCFWHGHDCARGARMPKTNRPYWQGKIARNRARDAANLEALAALGWRTLTIHECDLKDLEALRRRLGAALA